MTRVAHATIATVWGSLFGLGLAIAGLPRPQVIQGFLDIGPNWNPTLGVALCAAVAVYYPAHRLLLRRRSTPLLAPRFALPTMHGIDGRLIAGASLFGAGWGIAGMCPGANLVAIGGLGVDALLFAATWTLSVLASRHVERRLRTRRPALQPLQPRDELVAAGAE